MPERDYVGDTLEVGYRGVFDFDGLYKTLYQWFTKRGYFFRELDYKEYKEGGVQKLLVKWAGRKKMTDYVKYVIEVNLQLDGMTEVVVKNKKRLSGGLGIKIAGYLEKDYEETWSRTKFAKFMREAVDKFVAGSKMQEMQQELFQEMQQFRQEVKAFLNLYRSGK